MRILKAVIEAAKLVIQVSAILLITAFVMMGVLRVVQFTVDMWVVYAMSPR